MSLSAKCRPGKTRRASTVSRPTNASTMEPWLRNALRSAASMLLEELASARRSGLSRRSSSKRRVVLQHTYSEERASVAFVNAPFRTISS